LLSRSAPRTQLMWEFFIIILSESILDIRSTVQVKLARMAVQELAARLGFGGLDRTKFVTATSELARNTLVHGKGGTVSILEIEREGKIGIRLVLQDTGPGIPDIDRALQDGFSTAKSMGLGLGGAQRLVDEFAIASVVGMGTKVTITHWKRS
jgi:serine/threonine-protein kinase RsbT